MSSAAMSSMRSAVAPILITLISGTVSSLANKVVYDTPIEGSCGKNKFQKAYFFTLCMFLGEWMCLGQYYIKEYMRKRREAAASSYQVLAAGPADRLQAVNPLVAADSFGQPAAEPVAAAKPPIWVYAVLCVFDLSATAVGGVGLIWVDASTNQMLRGSMIVFSAIFSVLMLKRRLSRAQWGCIGLVCTGLALVGLSGMMLKKYDPDTTGKSDEVSTSQFGIGILLVLLASALNSIQGVFEEKLLKAVGGAEVDPLELVGWEGFFGTILSAFVLLPIVHHIPGSDCGKAEDSINTLEQLGNSPMAIVLCLCFIFGLMLMNWTSQQISQQLSAVHRNLVSAVRTVLVWVGSIILYYATKNDETVYGEKWTRWSLLELAGFFVLVGGTVLYSYAGMVAARRQEAEEEITGQVSSSPDFVLPIEPGLREHQVIAKQNSFHERQAHVNGGHAYHQSVYDNDSN